MSGAVVVIPRISIALYTQTITSPFILTSTIYIAMFEQFLEFSSVYYDENQGAIPQWVNLIILCLSGNENSF